MADMPIYLTPAQLRRFANQQREQVLQHAEACFECHGGDPCEMGLLLIGRWFRAEADSSLLEATG